MNRLNNRKFKNFVFCTVNEIRTMISKRFFRFSFTFVMVMIAFKIFEIQTEWIWDKSGDHWSLIENIMYLFWGQREYRFSGKATDGFTVPFVWLFVIALLMFNEGDLIGEDYNSHGVLKLVRSQSRLLWWLSKCITALVGTLIYMVVIVLVGLGYEWLEFGGISTDVHAHMIINWFGTESISLFSENGYMIFTVIILFLIFQSLMFLFLNMLINNLSAVIIMISYNIAGVYYGNAFFPFAYGMLVRYCNSAEPGITVLNETVGSLYLLTISLIIIVVGGFIFTKKDII
ncbi:MAG: hypothetical protein IKQ71_01915 [Lachnospiraceae bacterium]|nr:hypothetical protein [Lachnospiraceae bacterium]